MNGPALDSIDFVAECGQSLGDFPGGLVGECENADAVWIDAERFDQITNALDQTKSLAGTGAGEDKRRPWRRLNGRELRGSRCPVMRGGVSRN